MRKVISLFISISPNEHCGGMRAGVLPDFFFCSLFGSADHERDWPPCQVVYWYHSFFRVGNQYAEGEKQQLSTSPFHTISGCGKREAHITWSMVTCKGSTRYWNYLEDYWPCVGGLSAGSAIGTQLRDLENSGLTRWRMWRMAV